MSPKYRAICNQYGILPFAAIVVTAIVLILKEHHTAFDAAFFLGMACASGAELVTTPVLKILRINPTRGSTLLQGIQIASMVAGIVFGLVTESLAHPQNWW